ncbi:MAG: CRTAC1 family protein [Cyclobacteriaceae bacterium]
MKSCIKLLFLGQFLLSCHVKQADNVEYPRSAGNIKMAHILQELADKAYPEHNYTLNDARAESYLRLHKLFGTSEDDEYLLKYAKELVNAGQNKKAIDILEKSIDELGLESMATIDKRYYPYFIILGMAYTQMAEEQNCVMGHTARSCIVPIQGEGIHKQTSASEKAIETYTKILKSIPEDLNARWLLNLAYMTLGLYPEHVPDKYVIPGLDKQQGIDFPAFTDIAGQLGIDVMGLAGGVCSEDFDNDGDIDLMVTSYGLQDQLRYIEQQSGKFTEKTLSAGLEGIVSGLNMVHADYNNDGFEDILVLRGAWFKDHGRHPNSLLKNHGDGTFEDVTEQAGLLSYYPTQTASWADYDLDGHLDLFIANESSGNFIHPCELYHNNGDGTFAEVSRKVGIRAYGMFKGSVWGDVNNDGYPDLYLSDYAGKNKLYLNKEKPEGKRLFEEIGEQAGVQEPLFSFPCWFFDYNNDGHEDLFVSGFDQNRLEFAAYDEARELLGQETKAAKPRLYKNNGDLTFTEVSQTMGLDRVVYTMGSNFGDLDNDGWLDFYLGTGTPDLNSIVPNRMYWNKLGKTFEDVTMNGGFGHIQKGHGVAFADFDNDGDQDVYAVMGGAVSGDTFHNVLFENPGFGNNWITIDLEGATANRSAIGARIHLVLELKDGDERHIYRTVNTGGTFGSGSIQQEIGLGKANKMKNLEITWPDSLRQKENWKDLPFNVHYRIKQAGDLIQISNNRTKRKSQIGDTIQTNRNHSL